jgi:hypothetical protein
VYTITDVEHPNYMMPGVAIDPAFCPFTETIVISPLKDGSSAIEEISDEGGVTGYEHKIYYDNLKPLGPPREKQTVTVTVTSNSPYANDKAVTETGDWELTFRNPCNNPDFVEIVPAEIDDIDY